MLRNTRRAFTLIELLLVMVILAVLASVVVPVYFKQMERSRFRATLTDIRQLKTSLAAFQLDNGRFPLSSEGLNALVFQPGDLAGTWNGPYIEQVTPDKWGTAYRYIYPDPENPSNYKLFSCGSDKQEYTADDITQYTLDDGTVAQAP